MTAPSPQFKMVEPKMEFKNNFDLKNNYDLKGTYSFGSSRTRLGIRAQDTEDGKGAKVLKVDDESPADKAGIREDDIITEFEGKDVRNADDLVEAARLVKDQSSMSVKIQRDGRSQTVEIKVPKKLKTTNL
jgi:serine protease Do